MTQLGDVARHYALRAVLVLGLWGLTKIAGLGRNRKRQGAAAPGGAGERTGAATPPAAGAAAAAAPATSPAAAAAAGGGGGPQPRKGQRYKVYHQPGKDFRGGNPGWLQEAVSLDPAALAIDLSWQCPLLIQFQAAVAAGQAAGGGKGPAQSSATTGTLKAKDKAARVSSGGGGGGALPVPLPAFGRDARQQLFVLDPEVSYLNHGSYGAAFRLSLEVQAWYQRQLEAQPVRFMETVALKGLVAATADAARFVGASPSDVVPVVNATGAVNAVLRSVRLRRGDWVLVLNTTYPAVKSMVARVAAAADASVIEVQLGLEDMTRPDAILAAVQSALTVGGRRIKVAVLDHVVSFPPLVLPVAAMAAACKQVGAQVLVDGAHAVGNVPGLQVPALGADFYVTNLHKWGCSPKGAALLWAAPERQAALLPNVTSHGYGLGFRGEFLWQGTSDPCAWLAVPAALAVLRALGPQRVAQHNARLVSEAAAALRRRWEAAAAGSSSSSGGSGGASSRPRPAGAGAAEEGTGAEGAEASGERAWGGGGGRRLVQLGGGGEWGAGEQGAGVAGMLALELPPMAGYGCTAGDAVRLQRWLRGERNIEVPVVCALGRLWVRISAQIYNTLGDYERLGEAIEGLAVAAAGR